MRSLRSLILPIILVSQASFGGAWPSGYREYPEIEKTLTRWALANPGLVHLEVYGHSTQGRALYALTLASTNGNSPAPALMITAATHGDETVTTEFLLAFMKTLIEGYGRDARLTALVDQHRLCFIPVVSPDSYVAQTRFSDGSDPNRSYPSMSDPGHPPVPVIASLITYFLSKDFKGTLDLHASGGFIMYPWAAGGRHLSAPEKTVFNDLAVEMAQVNGYPVGPVSMFEGSVGGSSVDFYYWKKKSMAYAVELSSSKAPPAAQLPRVLEFNREMLEVFIEHFGQ